MYEDYKIYGPYENNQGYLFVILIAKNGSRKTKSYAKYILEKHFNREINEPYTVDHIDKNPMNNSIRNLRILERSNHIKLDIGRVKYHAVSCTNCGKKFIPTRWQGKGNGVFCSRRCSGTYARSIQLNAAPIASKVRIKKTRYTLKNTEPM